MSEYQYYEFQALDRPLTQREMRELRRYLTRATITATRFVNHYEWGNFKGDASSWMRKHFDAFLSVGLGYYLSSLSKNGNALVERQSSSAGQGDVLGSTHG